MSARHGLKQSISSQNNRQMTRERERKCSKYKL